MLGSDTPSEVQVVVALNESPGIERHSLGETDSGVKLMQEVRVVVVWAPAMHSEPRRVHADLVRCLVCAPYS